LSIVFTFNNKSFRQFTMLSNLCDFQQPSFLVGGQSWLLVFEIGSFEQGLLLSTFC